MRLAFAALAASLLVAAPAAAEEKPGDRTRTPEQMMREFGFASDQDDLAAAIAAAQAYPLGTIRNPVRVGGPEGERAYIARLRCSNGEAPRVGARTAAGAGAFGSVVASYSLDCGAAAPGRFSLIMDMYHEEHDETAAPAGFTLAPR